MPESPPLDVTAGPAAQAVGTAAPAAPVAEDWPAQAADTIVRVVGQVRDKTTGPIQKAARATVYGLLALLLSFVCAVLFAISLVRILDSYVVGEGNTWLAHLIVGFVFLLPGLLLWRKGKQRPEV
jgi:hypothetical protein